jgi:hypothetical protein
MCGQHKESVRQRKVITVGIESGVVRTKFCGECAATVSDWSRFEKQNRATPRFLKSPDYARKSTPLLGRKGMIQSAGGSDIINS